AICKANVSVARRIFLILLSKNHLMQYKNL
ncbi:hypothetical protein, partial [Escherichia coli]